MGATPEIVRLALETAKPIDMVAGAYFAAARTICVDRLRLAAERMNLPEHWDRLAVRRLIDDLFVHQRALAARALSNGTQGADRAAGNAAVEAWANAHRDQVDRVDHLIGDLERSGAFTVARLTLGREPDPRSARRLKREDVALGGIGLAVDEIAVDLFDRALSAAFDDAHPGLGRAANANKASPMRLATPALPQSAMRLTMRSGAKKKIGLAPGSGLRSPALAMPPPAKFSQWVAPTMQLYLS